MNNPPRLRKAVALLVALVAAVGVTIAVTTGSDPAKPGATTVTITLGGPGQKQVQLPPAAQAQATAQAKQGAAGDENAAHSDLRETRDQEEQQLTDAAANARQKPAGQDAIPATPPLAAQNVPGCRTLLVRNYSSRNGAPVLLFVFHYTVSIDNGWNGVLANVKWFDTAAASASSTYIVDRKIGACALTVAEQSKAWAQAAYNPWALSLEVTATGKEGSYLPPGPGRQRVIDLMHRAHRVYKLPYRQALVAGGRVLRTGFLRHKDLGPAGGGHVDTDPYAIDDLIAEAARTDATRITSVDRVTCRRLNWWRDHGRPHGKPERNAIRRRNALTSRGVRCVAGGPLRV